MNHQGTKTPRVNGYKPVSEREDVLGRHIVDAAFKVHSRLGPGLLESVYETCFCYELAQRGVQFRRQLSLPVQYDKMRLESALRIDVLVDELVICELKAAETTRSVFEAQLLTYLKLTGLRLGFLINFNVPVIRYGIKRMVL